MLLRHKIPTIFNIYMLDVICCALGCVVLLWQVAHQEAEQQTADAKESHAEAQKQAEASLGARMQFVKARHELQSASKDVAQLRAELTAWQSKHQELTLALASTEKDRAQAYDALRVSRENLKKLEAALAGAVTVNVDLRAKIAGADRQAKEQAAALARAEEASRNLALDVKDAEARVNQADAQLKMRTQDLERARKELRGGAGAGDKIAALAAERDQLRAERDTLNRRVTSLQADAEQRFAGIPLSGESVVFLIDISGSMTMQDVNTDDPDKWPFLCDSLMKLMQSIPTMQRFQVILFADKTRYLFGNRDAWLKYEGPATAKLTRDALRKVKVEGGTNMEAGFEEAFRFRKLKLDTIYLFSDGLPNIGSGVPANLRNPTEEQRNQFIGKFVRDKLKSDWNRPQEGQSDVRINAVGFFFESPDVGAFLWAMAREHRGAFVGLR